MTLPCLSVRWASFLDPHYTLSIFIGRRSGLIAPTGAGVKSKRPTAADFLS